MDSLRVTRGQSHRFESQLFGSRPGFYWELVVRNVVGPSLADRG